ncbi:hypothetical protein [Pedobacter metabolipauper]|uniref:Uncharacterized protein n=1 Tax=Pedobacter metabolipauper TaxID=425513 RepID=A0A4R6SQ57_9SPHI|nr:hypothetical protein [Pedobacter metabolipauper]TDQ06881.1 hypothetical protein ATK78_3893 [Pedobacter metabolipauper]
MRNRKVNLVLAIAVFILVAWMLKGTFTQPGADNLKAGFKEIAHYRNENNTGPIQHVYSVTVKDSLWSEMEIFGNFKPHHKGGNTKVYYFMEGSPAPVNLGAGSVNFNSRFNPYCIAIYEKSAMGDASLIRHPFK